MNTTQRLHDLGQRLWLDSISRDLITRGTLRRYIERFSITGLTSNPTIFDDAIGGSTAYDAAIRDGGRGGQSTEALLIEIALGDLRCAADLLRPVYDATQGIDGWVSMEVPPLLAHDARGSIEAAVQIVRDADRPNLFVKIPGTSAGISAIEESIVGGVPINVTLLFSREQYLAAAEAYIRGIERRIDAGLSPSVASVASVFVSRWDRAANKLVPAQLRNQLGIAIAGRTYHAYRQLLGSPRWQKLAERGAQPQRLLWASTGVKDLDVSDTLYVEALAAPDTINTLPEKTLLALVDHGQPGPLMAGDGCTAEATLERFAQVGVDIEALAQTLQSEGVQAFVQSWQQLMQRVAAKRVHLDAGTRRA